jgi:putative Holliday junction resolvase
MGRIVAIDYGTARVGLATTDPLKIIATPLGTFPAKEVMEFLVGYHIKEVIEKFVVGMPKTLNNEPSSNAASVHTFIGLMKKKFPLIPIVLEDERFTSKIAKQTMLAGGMKKKDRRVKSNVDKISATIILQSHLASGLI